MNSIGVDGTRTVLGRGQGQDGWDGYRGGEEIPPALLQVHFFREIWLHVGQLNCSQGSGTLHLESQALEEPGTIGQLRQPLPWVWG